MRIVVWFRQDLRVRDHPALFEAAKLGEVIPVYIWSPEEEEDWKLGQGSQSWLKESLIALNEELEGKLILKKGQTLRTLLQIMQHAKSNTLFFNRRYEPATLKRDLSVLESCEKKGIDVQTFNASLLIEPWEIGTKAGKPYQVFTPFVNTAMKLPPSKPLGKPHIRFAKTRFDSLNIEQLGLHSSELDVWSVGEEGAMRKLTHFVTHKLAHYEEARDRPDLEGVSRLSPHLHFGEISPKQVLEKVQKKKGSKSFIRELYWREFAYHLLFHFPDTPTTSLHREFEKFQWEKDEKAFAAWKQGKTGFPLIDAGMRQLLSEGWMHNRVRMLVASFLTKDLLIPWQKGARWFWEKLVDADLASNTLGWQWTAGCGADAAPYFRIFNPVSQSKKFDPEGRYIRKYVPELKNVAHEWIHSPWEAPSSITGYPSPIIDHTLARERALKRFHKIKTKSIQVKK